MLNRDRIQKLHDMNETGTIRRGHVIELLNEIEHLRDKLIKADESNATLLAKVAELEEWKESAEDTINLYVGLLNSKDKELAAADEDNKALSFNSQGTIESLRQQLANAEQREANARCMHCGGVLFETDLSRLLAESQAREKELRSLCNEAYQELNCGEEGDISDRTHHCGRCDNSVDRNGVISEKLARFGGAGWVRDRIDRAKDKEITE